MTSIDQKDALKSPLSLQSDCRGLAGSGVPSAAQRREGLRGGPQGPAARHASLRPQVSADQGFGSRKCWDSGSDLR